MKQFRTKRPVGRLMAALAGTAGLAGVAGGWAWSITLDPVEAFEVASIVVGIATTVFALWLRANLVASSGIASQPSAWTTSIDQAPLDADNPGQAFGVQYEKGDE